MIYIFLFALGALIGSFLNVCIYRLPQAESIVLPASHCPVCFKKLGVLELIPLFSFLFQKGKCRSCGGKISFVYPVVELLSALSLVSLYIRYGFDYRFFFYAVVFFIFIVIFFIDLLHLVIPDSLVGAGVLFCLLMRGLEGEFGGAWLGGLAGFLALFLLLKTADFIFQKETMGMGDVYLAGFLGVFLGITKIFLGLFLAYFFAALVGIILIGLKIKKRQDPIPFGPFLVLGAVVASLGGAEILNWYFSMLQ